MAGFSALGTRVAMRSAAFHPTSSGWVVQTIGDLTNVSGPTLSAEEIDVSSHDSTGNYREFVSGFLDGGEVSLEGNLTAGGGADDLLTAFGDRTGRYFAVVFPATGTNPSTAATAEYGLNYWLRWTFEGTVTGVETAAPYDDKASFSATVRLSGAPTLTASSSTST